MKAPELVLLDMVLRCSAIGDKIQLLTKQINGKII